MIVLNLIVADQLRKFKLEVDALIAKKVGKEDAPFPGHQKIQQGIKENQV